MPAPDFPGRARLIDTIERAFNGTKIDPAQLKQALESLYHEHSVVLPAPLLRPDPGSICAAASTPAGSTATNSSR